MKLSKLKEHLSTVEQLIFQVEHGEQVPTHFHVTEVGEITKHFIDCGGVERIEKKINFQLWFSDDVDHKLQATKLKKIIQLSEQKLGLGNHEIEVEYQIPNSTIGKYQLGFNEGKFILKNDLTACLAEDKCGIEETKPKVSLSSLSSEGETCTPGGGCC